MSVNPVAEQPVEAKISDKEINFRRQEEALLKKVEQEKQARLALEQRLAELEKGKSKIQEHDDEEDDSDPYVDRKKLKKALSEFGRQSHESTKSEIQRAVHTALEEERKQQWLKQNPDFDEIMGHAEAFYRKDPELAETILKLPESFERVKLVYKNIKALNLHKKEEDKPSIQDTIDRNRRSPFFNPQTSTSPYQSQGDFSAAGQKSAYEKMQQLKKSLRIN